jgi:hypothetical protein
MITRRMAAALVAGSLAVGLVAGTAGTIIAKDATPSQTAAAACLEHMDDMDSMMSGSGAGMMSGSGAGMMSGSGAGMMSGSGAGMMSGSGAGMMSGTGGMMGSQSGSGAMPDWMQQHHAAATPAPVR